MDTHILAIQFRFYMGIVLLLYQTIFPSNRKSISRKIRNIIHVTYFFLFINMLICPSDIISSTTSSYVVRASFHFEMLFSTQPINLVVEKISNHLILQIKKKNMCLSDIVAC